ncbi:MAG: response regulator [Caldilineaceae bacterium]|nr:response regulator [Caldilineaceae bacterium]
MTKILVIEDDPMILKLIFQTLQRSGYEVITAMNGSEGLRIAQENHPNLVVLDISLPGLDGYQVCQQLRSAPATASLPIIMVTAMSRPADQRRGFELGADDYLPKPFLLADLVTRVQSLLFFA